MDEQCGRWRWVSSVGGEVEMGEHCGRGGGEHCGRGGGEQCGRGGGIPGGGLDEEATRTPLVRFSIEILSFCSMSLTRLLSGWRWRSVYLFRAHQAIMYSSSSTWADRQAG